MATDWYKSFTWKETFSYNGVLTNRGHALQFLALFQAQLFRTLSANVEPVHDTSRQEGNDPATWRHSRPWFWQITISQATYTLPNQVSIALDVFVVV